MSTLSEREEALRRALFSAAESIEPAPDGLDRIRARLGPSRPWLVAWLEGIWAGLAGYARGFAEDSRRWLASGVGFAWHRFAPAHAAPGQRNLLRWFRPLAAMAVAIFVVAAGVYVGLSASLSISPTNTTTGSVSSGTHHPGGGNGSTAVKASSPASSGSPGSSVSPSSSASCASSSTAVLPGLTPPSSPSPTTSSGAPTTSPPTSSPPASSPATGSTSPTVAGSQVPTGSGSQAQSANSSGVVTTAASRCSKHKKNAGHTLTDAQAAAAQSAAVLAAFAPREARLNASAS